MTSLIRYTFLHDLNLSRGNSDETFIGSIFNLATLVRDLTEAYKLLEIRHKSLEQINRYEDDILCNRPV